MNHFLKYPFLLILACAHVVLSAQSEFQTYKTAPKKAKEAYQKGRTFHGRGDYKNAAVEYSKALKIAPDFMDAYLGLGAAYALQNDFAAAEGAWEKAASYTTDYEPIILVSLAEVEWEQNKFEEAAAHSEAFLKMETKNDDWKSRASILLQNSRFAAKAIKNPVPFNPEPIPGLVNSAMPEYLPSLTADGQTMVFTRRDFTDENFYLSTLDADGKWTEPEFLEDVNTVDNEGAEFITADGNIILYTYCTDNPMVKGHIGSCDLYYTLKRNGKWTKPRPFGRPVNLPSWDAQPCLSADGKELYFSSERPNGKGGKDLWVSRRGGEKNQWQTPENLGGLLNTPLNEQTPFLHPDGQTLYFTSNGHPGMGSNDVFLSRRQPDGSWGKPENLGYPINTKGMDGTLAVSLDGIMAYYSAKSATGDDLDIFQFELPVAARPQAVTYVRVKVVSKDKRPIDGATALFSLMETGEEYASIKTDEKGLGLVALPAGKEYALVVAEKGYSFFSENFNFTEPKNAAKPYELTVELQKIEEIQANTPQNEEVKYAISLKNILFDSGSSALKKGSYIELQLLLQILESSPGQRIIIEGHTDNVGNDEDNRRLSEQRAKAVYDYLMEKGISASRLQFRGKGESEPIADNETQEGRAANRRTVVLFL